MQHTFELISFALCPFVQRAVIVLNKKKIQFKVTYIDLDNPPSWFLDISPLGKVPVLKVDDNHVIFESAVICELLDELVPPKLHSEDPFCRAKERAWMEFSSSLLGDHYLASRETESEKMKQLVKKLFTNLERFENVLNAPFFRSNEFSLVDAACAPLFTRMMATPLLANSQEWIKIPKTRKWCDALLADIDVKKSVLPNFSEEYRSLLKGFDSAMSW